MSEQNIQTPRKALNKAYLQSDPAADAQPLETQIDHLVYHLYNITPEETAIVEGANK